MKKGMIFITAFALLISLVGCGGSSVKNEKEPEATYNKCTKYACPMHPDRTSTEAINCPECKMPMKLLPDSLIKDTLDRPARR